ncbi:MAG: alpha/beta hydrolase [Cellulomonas sp.]|uniref:Alpha/beta hydrolase n=1 Tax=Cellulomonas gelida TaxID=1712 RepID=A0A4Y3KJ03_9CELL|nr:MULTISPECIES: alpha/beta hydrolase [Cellulomonas]KMM46699.1 alpha/beta hydrolase [Cellulomonas sp. A375-1]MCR6647724.1 alpha/beta hydrolase [Cellulomonas sp.]MCR6703714.1 alpha/beta hydrolase [Cellulomonas sp.]GEA84391.1 alpha/beta hydrolase [Cellulomonas gelida]GGL26348.1 alpha/beta hydrolase [Cellulomonas gelida]
METPDEGWHERRVVVDGHTVRVRCSADRPDRLPVVHVHGFAISGAYLMPTARRLAGHSPQVVPDLPGYGGSEGWGHTLGIPALADALLRVLDALELERVVLLGNSMGCPISLELAHQVPDRIDRTVLVSPAGGVQNQPLGRALRQLGQDVLRESTRMAPVALPDYVRFGPVNAFHLFSELTRFPSLERLLRTPVPALAVLGSRDPLMPPPRRVRELAQLAPAHVTVVLVEGAAHAVNFSHPGELAHVVRSWLDGEEIVDDPDEPGQSRVLQLGGR